MISLFLWHAQRITAPAFYISEYFEEHREDYVHQLNRISEKNDWETWVEFFLESVNIQAQRNAQKVHQVLELYQSLREQVQELLRSQYAPEIVDMIFTTPIFRVSAAGRQLSISTSTFHRLMGSLRSEGILSVIEPGAGRLSELLRFDALLELINQAA